MTEEQKEKLIAKMLDAPTSLSDRELEAIVADDELLDLYEMSARVERATAPHPDLDAAKEWALLRPRLRPRPSLSKRFMRVAAIFLGIAFASSIAVKVTDNILTGNQKAELAQAPEPTSLPSAPTATGTEADAEADATTALPEPKAAATRPSHAAKAPKEATANTGEKTIDVDEYLRIQQAKIDNELALLQAETMGEQQSMLNMMTDHEGGNNENFRLTTMQ